MNELLIRPEKFRNRTEDFGYDFLSFATRKLEVGQKFWSETAGKELAIVVLGGVCSVTSSRGDWHGIGQRETVFDGLPYTLYLPIRTTFTVSADTACELAFCYCKAEEEYPARLVTPAHVGIEIRGGGNATRQINSMLPPGFLAQRLMVVEVFTPAGNWSSYPPHKHDVHNPPDEVDLEEIYYYRMERPEGYRSAEGVHGGPAHRRDDDGARWRAGAGSGGLPSGGGCARIQRVLSERAGGFGAVDGLLGRSGLCMGEEQLEGKGPEAADG